MKPLCARTINGVIKGISRIALGIFIVRLFSIGIKFGNLCSDDGETKCTRQLLLIVVPSIGSTLFLWIGIWMLRKALVLFFRVACGHRRCTFTGRSSKPLREILLSVDKEIPTEEELQTLKYKALLYLNDIKNELEKKITTTTFQYIFSGSAVERYGIPLSHKNSTICCLSFKNSHSIGALDTDLDVMLCSLADIACFSGEGNILVEPLVFRGVGFTGYARLASLTPDFKGKCISSRVIRDQVKDAVGNTSVSHLPGTPCCCGKCEMTTKIELDSKGPAVKIRIGVRFEADITLCIKCPEWPMLSDWPSRPRYWPSVVEAQRLISLGCHLVAKPAPNDGDQTSWRFSFSLAEVELSKLVPETARKCFLALKIILKDHLQPVVPEIGSYHIKTIFLNTLEKVPVGFWVEDNIEECFLTLLMELHESLVSNNCPHHWFSSINLFKIRAKKLRILAKKVQRIVKDPAPFVFDDGCCCLSSCCSRVPQYHFYRRMSKQFLAEYDEITISADGQVVTQIQDPDNYPYQLPVPLPQRSEARPDPSLLSSVEEDSQETTARPVPLVVPLPPKHNAEQEPILCLGEVEKESFGEVAKWCLLPPIHDVQPESNACSGDEDRRYNEEPAPFVINFPARHSVQTEHSIGPSET